MKIVTWSELSVNSKPLSEQLFGSFVKILSISLAEFEVILVGREMGKTIWRTLYLKIHLFCHETDVSVKSIFQSAII